MANITRMQENMMCRVIQNLRTIFLFIPLWNPETSINTRWTCQKIQDSFYSIVPTLCEKHSTFYVTVVLSLLLQATGNEAQNRRWTENTWLFFCSQLLNGKSLDHFPKCPAIFCLLSLLSYLYDYMADWQCKIQKLHSGNLTFRLRNYLPDNSDHHLPRHILKLVRKRVPGI